MVIGATPEAIDCAIASRSDRANVPAPATTPDKNPRRDNELLLRRFENEFMNFPREMFDAPAVGDVT
jgi:hypothetical protein